MRQVCGCRKGYASADDGKCGHCRTKRETKAREQRFYQENRMSQALNELQAKIDRLSGK